MPAASPIRAVTMATAALMTLPGLVAALNDLPYVLHLSDQASALKYDPMPVSFNGTATWNSATQWTVEYSGSTWSNGAKGQGASAHTTRWPGAKVACNFVGTGVAFLGTKPDGATVTLNVDGAEVGSPPEGGALASVSGLAKGAHTAFLTVKSQGSVVSITGVDVSTWISSEATSLDRVHTIEVSPGQAFSGWGAEGESLCTMYSGAIAEYAVPPKTSFLELWGPSGITFTNQYDISVEPASSNDLQSHTGVSFNPWETDPNVMYFAALDPTVQYTVKIVNYSRKRMCISKAVVYSSESDATQPVQSGSSSALGSNAGGSTSKTNAAGASGTAASDANVVDGADDGDGDGAGSGSGGGGKKSNAGAIAGGVAGGLAALAAIVALVFFLRRRKRNARSRQQAMYKATSSTRNRPGSWQPFFGAAALGSQGSHASKDLELLPPSFGADKSSRHTSMQTYDSTTGSAPMTPPVGEFGAPILPHDEVSKFTPTPYSHYGGSHTSIPSQSSLPPITEMPRTIPPGHSFATISTMAGGGALGGTAASRARSGLTSASSDTVDSLPSGWPSPPTSPLRSGPRPPPRKHMSRGSLSPPASPNPAPVSTMQPFGQPDLFD